MKKSFYFALALTAGLFASCSSDEIAQAPQGGLEINDNEAAQIKIGIANPGVTRGTGTVGAVATTQNPNPANNVWAGQTFNLFMFEKGTFKPAKKTVTNAQNQEEEVDIYNNAEMLAPNDPQSTAATYVIGNEEQFNYYPTTGVYSFWAYRVDDAGKGTAGVGEPAMYDAQGQVTTTEADAVDLCVPFTIDGSQDIMTAVPDEAADLLALQGVQGASSATADKIYTAYSARRNIKPTLNFLHKLTRLTFQVKANTIEVSDQATPVSNDPGVYPGFKVTGITIKSKVNGKIVAAWKTGSTHNKQEVVFDDANEDWADLNSLTALSLKSRGNKVNNKQTNYWSDQISLAVAVDGTITYAGTYTLGTAEYTINAQNGPDLYLYDVNTENSYTGLPNGTRKKVSEWLAAYIADPANAPAANTNDVCKAGTIKGYAQAVNQALDVDQNVENAAAGLMDLKAITPEWTGNTAASTTYYKCTAVNGGWSQWSTNEIQGATEITGTTTEPTAAPAGGAGSYYYTDDQSVKHYATYTALTYTWAEQANYVVAGGETQVQSAPTTATVGAVNDVVYVSVAAQGGNSIATNVGEALLVAPGAPSYEMVLTYKRWKQTSTSNYSEIEGSVKKTISRSGGANFAAGDSYNIIVTLYKDGDASTDTEITPWNGGEDIEVSGEDE